MSIIDSRLSFLNECINVLGSGRTACAFAFTSDCCVIDFETEFCMHWYVLIFEVVIRVRCGVFRCTALSQSHPRLLSKHNDDDDWSALIFVEWIKHYRRPCTNRLYVCGATCLPLKVLFVFTAVWGRNLTHIPCQNMLHRQWSVCFHVISRSAGTIKSEARRGMRTRVRCPSTFIWCRL